MEFGRVSPDALKQVNFDLPAPHLACPPADGKAVFYVGCPVWAHKAWLGEWYPAHAKEGDFLRYYAQQFNTIELNSTHYQIPHPQTVANWRGQVGEDFRFCPKFLQDISHSLLPRGEAKDMTRVFCETMRHFEGNLGQSFLQLPPYFGAKDAKFLWKFLDELPEGYALAVEFRHESWFVGETFLQAAEMLAQRGIGTVITDTAGRRDATHMTLSLPTLMLRFLGNDLHETDYTRVSAWVGKIGEMLKLGVDTFYLFAHEPDNRDAPALACYLIDEIARQTGISLPKPTPTGGKQIGLF